MKMQMGKTEMSLTPIALALTPIALADNETLGEYGAADGSGGEPGMNMEGKNTGGKPVDRNKQLKLEDGKLDKGETSGSVRSTLDMGEKRGLSPVANCESSNRVSVTASNDQLWRKSA